MTGTSMKLTSIGNAQISYGPPCTNESNYEGTRPTIECEGWRRHSSLIFLILLFTKPIIEVSGWLYQTKTHFTHIAYQPYSRVSPPSFTLYEANFSIPKHSEKDLSPLWYIFEQVQSIHRVQFCPPVMHFCPL